MKITLLIIITTFLSLGLCHTQKITDSGYRTIGYFKADGTIKDGSTFLFIPSALYAYWVSKYLFEEKTNQILLPENDA